MNCPNAVKVYQREQRSYKDLPMRINTVDVIHRKEKSGELNGLFRVQMFRQDDAHNLIREDQIESEIQDMAQPQEGEVAQLMLDAGFKIIYAPGGRHGWALRYRR